MSPRAVLVTLGPVDAGEVLTVQRAAYITEAQLHDELALPPLTQSMAELAAELADPAVIALGLRESGRLVAAVRVRVDGGVAHLARLAVVPDRQGHGLGTRLLLAAEEAVPATVQEIRLFTGERSAANLRLYARHGYTVTGRTPAGSHELVHLAKTLPVRSPRAFTVARESASPADVGRLLRSLPDWFGIESAIESYVQDAARLATWTARAPGGEVVGVLLLAGTVPEAPEVHLIAVAPDRHRQGIGRALLDAAVAQVRADGARLLSVKTLGPSDPDPGYALTRAFYLAEGFQPVEELVDLWPGNPCLIMVRSL